MAKKKKIKFNKKQRKQILAVGIPILAALVGLVVGITGAKLLSGRSAPTNLVWAADSTVKVPRDLRKFLESKDECKNYRGNSTPDGIGLWGVYQVSQAKFAKIAYGCSWDLNTYKMAVKQNGKWQLIEPAKYFAPFKNGIDASGGALPFCTVVEEYKIPKDIESFCILPDGSAKPNET